MNAKTMREFQARFATKWKKRVRPAIPRKSQHDSTTAEYVTLYCRLNYLKP